MSHIFISYSTKNSKYASKLAEKLRAEGFNIWIDNQKLRAGEYWWESIVRALRRSDVFVVVMTPESRESEWVQREVALANKWGIPCFPLLRKGEEFEMYVLSNFVDVTNGNLPDPMFYEHLAEHTTRRSHPGKNLIEAVPEAPNPDDSEIREALKNPPSGNRRNSNNSRGLYVVLAVILLLIAIPASFALNNVLPDPTEIASLPTLTPQPSPTATMSCTSSQLTLTGWRANGIGVYGAYDAQSEDEATVHQFPNEEQHPVLVAHAQYVGEQNWYLVEHPTRDGYFGWVKEGDVNYERGILHCLPIYSRMEFPRDRYPIWTGN